MGGDQQAKDLKPIQVVVSIREPTIRRSDNAASFVIDVNTLYITSKWENITAKPVYYRCEIYDGKGSLAFEMGGRLLTGEPFLYSSTYTPTSKTDAPGIWRIVLYTNGKMVYQRQIIGKRYTEII